MAMQKDCYTFALLYNQNKAAPRKGKKSCRDITTRHDFVYITIQRVKYLH